MTSRAPAASFPSLWLAAAALCFGSSAQAAAPGEPSESVECIRLDSLRTTHVVDERTLLFEMRDGTTYRNLLPRACPGIAVEERFLYRVSQNRLCALDYITVVENRGFGLFQGASCRLGRFDVIAAEAVPGPGVSSRSDP